MEILLPPEGENARPHRALTQPEPTVIYVTY